MNLATDAIPKSIEFLKDKALKTWLCEQGEQHGLKYLLAHADDGVIWGRLEKGLRTSHDAFKHLPQLRLTTLQQCRLFSQAGEILLWRSHNEWKYRFVGNPDCPHIREAQMLWGDHAIEEKDGFTLVADGSEGLHHAVPCKGISFKEGDRPLRLLVHHYVGYDENTGLAQIRLSRLADLLSG